MVDVDKVTEVSRSENDDMVGELFGRFLVNLNHRIKPSADEIEAANLELADLGVKICAV